jgi:hypothetical protein
MSVHVRPESLGELTVCDVCMFAHANGVDLRHESDSGNPEDPAPWALDQAIDVTMGRLSENHACGRSETTEAFDCDCERIEFTTTSCEGCGQTDHGTRHYFTWWGSRDTA